MSRETAAMTSLYRAAQDLAYSLVLSGAESLVGPQPWPAMRLDPQTRTVTYSPRVGDRRRRFASMAEARDYEVGFLAYPMGLHGDAEQSMVDGWGDAQRDVIRQFGRAAA